MAKIDVVNVILQILSVGEQAGHRLTGDMERNQGWSLT
jgi:hypothetical protein